MHKLLPLGLASLFLVVTGCQDTNTTGPLAGPDFHAMGAGHGLSSFAMLDDFATEKGASGAGKVNLQEGSVRVRVDAKGLLPNVDYELNVTIGPQPGGFTSFVTFTATSDRHGKIKFQGDIELDPGMHRLDLFVTHNHPTVVGSGPDGAFITAFIDRDPLLRCAPAVFLTVV